MAELRIGDRERESAVAALGEHYVQGRLTKDEYDERSDAAWTARTAGDLRPLFADLPSPAVRPVPAPVPVPPTRRPVPWKVLLVALAVVGVLTHGHLVVVALLLWFVLARHRTVPPPPWAHRGRGTGAPYGGPPPPPWEQHPGTGGHRR